jgi:acyl-CoA thioester hydrolase
MMTEFEITYRGTVYPWQCDHMGHMNVMWYTGKFDEASWQWLAQVGLTQSYLFEHGSALAAVEQNITYKRELYAGDVVSIRSRVLEVNEKTVRMMHEMIHDETGSIAAVAIIVGVYLDATLRKAIPLPALLRERFSPLEPLTAAGLCQ